MQTETISLNDNAYMTSYVCDDYRVDVKTDPKSAVIICPGGGWMTLSEREGEPIAIEFARRGYLAAVLHYSVADKDAVAGDFGIINKALSEAEMVYNYLTQLAEAEAIDKKRISVMGFSAGGQLAALFSSKHPELFSCILCYPFLDINDEFDYVNSSMCPDTNRAVMNKCFSFTGISSLSREKWHEIDPVSNINSDMPGTFIWHGAKDDLIRVTGSMHYAGKLIEKGIRTEFHAYDNCGHGISLGTRETAAVENEINDYCTVWFDQLIRWMEELAK